MLYSILLVAQVIISIALVVFVLIQHGKGADAGAAFGSGASATVFGSQGSANFLTRTTAILATLFFLNSLAMAYLVSHREGPKSVVDEIAVEQPADEQAGQAAPAAELPADVPVDVPAPAATQPSGRANDVPVPEPGKDQSAEAPAGK